MKLYFFLYFFITYTLHASSITIAVSANMSYAIKPLVKAFEQENNTTKVEIVLGSSGKLSTQITHGAPYDLFLSADMLYPKKLYQNGQTLQSPVVYAQGALVLLSTHSYDFTQDIITLLTSSTVEKIAIANPKTAPYGIATVEAFKHLNVYDKIVDKLVYGESISQTVTYATRACDMGIVAMSALYSPHLASYKKGIDWVALDRKLYTPIGQGMVILKRAKGRENVQNFYDFMLGIKAKEILKAYGYSVPQ